MDNKSISRQLQRNNKNNLSGSEKINRLIKYQEKLYNMKYINGEFYPKGNKNDRGRKES